MLPESNTPADNGNNNTNSTETLADKTANTAQTEQQEGNSSTANTDVAETNQTNGQSGDNTQTETADRSTDNQATDSESHASTEADSTSNNAGIPGIDRPFRQPNPDHTPNPEAIDMMNTPEFAKWVDCVGLDCGELADKLFAASGEKGNVLKITSANSIELRTPEVNGYKDYYYHEVYTDGRYIFDPRLSGTPIPKGDYLKLIRALNPDGINIVKVK